ncbi:MAG: tetratricopeptide (TPR) repeat protein [Bradymonadia bacterium]|jgi:tetratricopeptide (TPR) repeat protein
MNRVPTELRGRRDTRTLHVHRGAGACIFALGLVACGARQPQATPPLLPLAQEPEIVLCSALDSGVQRPLDRLANSTARVMLASTGQRPVEDQALAAQALGGAASDLWTNGHVVDGCADDIGYGLVAAIRSPSTRRWRDAAARYEQIVGVQTMAADEAWRHDDIGAAVSFSRSATLLAPTDCAALLVHARLLRDGLFRAQDALGALDGCDDPHLFAVTQYERGLTLDALGRTEQAAESHRGAAAADATYFSPRAELGRIAYEAGELVVAIEILREAEAIDPGAPDILVNLAVALEESSHDYTAVGDLYERAIASDPTYVGAYLNYGTLLIDALGQLERGSIYLRDALAIEPTLEAARLALEALAARPHLGVDALAGIWEAAYVDEEGATIRVLLTLDEEGGIRWVEQGLGQPEATEWSWLLHDSRGPQLFFEIRNADESRQRILEWRTDAEFDWYSMDSPVDSRLRFQRIGSSNTEARLTPPRDAAPAPSKRT